jgi:hypothetical protein
MFVSSPDIINENSSIVTEAILSGTPARFVQNKFLGEVIAEDELGNGGMVQGDSARDYERAVYTIDQGISQYYKKTDDFLADLKSFILKTQILASNEGFRDPVTVPAHNHLFSTHRAGLAKQIFQNQGLITLIRVAYHFAMRRLSWRYWMGREKI